ncbi:helix-turn-helix domain-containing protein [Nesterenkonia muleiensis]|uniref:helix-turn-helix domain-containing protein n=1 Tax=Nesterenkonia muleiensis TaxID=2282648 RepID=UPI000E75B5EC|nr:helix-turn-helix domain-containing protein [Nesterenkonia muleiensis]
MGAEDNLLIEEVPRHRFFRARRVALGLTQAQLAERTGTTQSVIAAIESGRRRLSPVAEKKLSEALRANPAELLARHRRRILCEAEELGFEAIKVFGSVAQGRATDESDIDFFVEFPADADHDAFAVIELRRRLESILSVPVDLMSVPKNPEDYGGIYRKRDEAIAV